MGKHVYAKINDAIDKRREAALIDSLARKTIFRSRIPGSDFRIAFGFREMFGFGRTDSVVRPGRRVQIGRYIGYVDSVDGITCRVSLDSGGHAIVFTSVIRGQREISERDFL